MSSWSCRYYTTRTAYAARLYIYIYMDIRIILVIGHLGEEMRMQCEGAPVSQRQRSDRCLALAVALCAVGALAACSGGSRQTQKRRTGSSIRLQDISAARDPALARQPRIQLIRACMHALVQGYFFFFFPCLPPFPPPLPFFFFCAFSQSLWLAPVTVYSCLYSNGSSGPALVVSETSNT